MPTTRCTNSSWSATRWRESSSRALLNDEKAAGRVRVDVDIDHVALEVIAMIMGLEYQWVTDPARVDFGQAMETYIDELIDRLAPAEDGPHRGR